MRRPLWTEPPKVYLWRSRMWIVLTLPVCLWWRSSVLVVLLISLYANWSTDIGNWRAARAEDAVRETIEPES